MTGAGDLGLFPEKGLLPQLGDDCPDVRRYVLIRAHFISPPHNRRDLRLALPLQGQLVNQIRRRVEDVDGVSLPVVDGQIAP